MLTTFNSTITITLLSLLLSCIGATSYAEVTLPKLISNGMVLQREQVITLWGWGALDEQVEVQLNGKPVGTSTTAAGKWQIQLAPQPAGGPHTITIAGTNTIALNDIYFGDVWLTSGQSNMDLPMRRVKHTYPREVAEANLPQVRVFTVPSQYDFNQVHNDVSGGQWLAVNPNNIEQFSAVSYFFAKALHQAKHIPIGIINSSMGGTTAESWLSEESLQAFPTHYQKAKQYQDKHYLAQLINSDKKAQTQWHNQLTHNDKGTAAELPWYAPEYKATNWHSMQVPGYWANHPSFKGVNTINGNVWFRKTITLPNDAANKAGQIWLGTIVDADTVYINGHKIGNTGYQYPPRLYPINKNILQAGENTIVVKITSNYGKGGFVLDKPYWLEVNNTRYDLKGEWQFKVGALSAPPPSSKFVSYTAPLGYYNAMLAPLLTTQIKGVVWYQGESNVGRAEEYKSLMATLIKSWRAGFNQPELPFIVVQLANFLEAQAAPSESHWAELREAQRQIVNSTSHTALVVTIDVGEWNDIHPVRKKEVGQRAAVAARHIAYNETALVHTGPQIRCFEQHKQSITLHFEPSSAALKAPHNVVHGIQIQTEDAPFHWVRGHIKGNTVEIDTKSTNAANNIKKVRYAWADNPSTANLFNSVGLPAAPFEITKHCEH